VRGAPGPRKRRASDAFDLVAGPDPRPRASSGAVDQHRSEGSADTSTQGAERVPIGRYVPGRAWRRAEDQVGRRERAALAVDVAHVGLNAADQWAGLPIPSELQAR